MEVWDAYTRDFEKIEGMTLICGERIPEEVYHLVSDVIVKHIDGDYLLMQRDNRRQYGGMWEATAGGSAIQGESPLACAMKELREETGIESEKLSEVGRVVNHDTIYCEFLCVTDCEKNGIELQPGETSAFKWISKEELLRMKKEKVITKRMQAFINNLSTLEYREYTAFQLDEVANLYARVGWTNYVNRTEILQQAYENSLYILGAYDHGRLIGIIRAVGDELTVVFIQDIIVLPEYQRRGIGTKLLQAVLEKYKDAYQVELLTDNTDKAKAFYRSAGLVPSDELDCLAFIRM